MSNHERVTDGTINHDSDLPEIPWWQDLPQDKPVRIIITGKRIPLDQSLPTGDKRAQAMSNGTTVVQSICDYMTGNTDLFPDFDQEKINRMNALGMLVMNGTPQQLDALMQCDSVQDIIPDAEIKVDLL